MKKETKTTSLGLFFSGILLLLAFLLPGMYHQGAGTHHSDNDPYHYHDTRDNSFGYSFYKTIFGGDGYGTTLTIDGVPNHYPDPAKDVGASIPMIIGFVSLILFILLTLIIFALESKNGAKKQLYIAQIILIVVSTFFLSPIFSSIAVSQYNSHIPANSQYGQNYAVHLSIGAILSFIVLLGMSIVRIFTAVRQSLLNNY